MSTMRHSISKACIAVLTLAFGLSAGAALAEVDPPDRVARVSFLRGNVSFQPAGDDQWAEMSLNRPIVTGDKVYADRDSRAELEIGAATLRVDEGSTLNLLNLDDNIAQIELTEGTLNLHVRRVFDGQSYEIDTPTLAFVVNRPGDYRIDIAPQGDSTMVTVFEGAGDVYGENNASYSVNSGNSYKFHDSALRDYEVFDLPRRDDFDQWCSSRNERYERAVSRQYVSEDVIGYADLDDYGSWNDERDYGAVWYPSRVEAGWTPYRSGHWSWIDPWGWSWVDSSPWGFAPFHYGRWAYIGNRWGWCPGARRLRPVYAPALVGFVGGGGWGVSIGINSGPVGWFPLGPRDVYVPWYRASRNYFTNVNVRNTTIINNTYITNVYNDYSRGRPVRGDYAYRNNVNAVTAVSRDAFVGARPVSGARVQVNETNLRNAQVVSRLGIAPERASFAATAGRGRAAPAAALDRRVIARTAPPAQAAPIASRIQAIQRNGAQPLARNQLAPQRPAAQAGANRGAPNSRVQVVGQNSRGTPQPLPARSAAAPTRPGTVGNDRAAPNLPGARGGATTPNRATVPAPADAQRVQPGNRAQPNAPSDRAGALPSSRFAPRSGTPGDNRAPASRGSVDAPNRAATPASPRSTNEPAVRGNQGGALPSNRYAPRTQPADTRATPRPQQQPSAPRSTPSFDRGSTPAPRSTPAPQPRSTPQYQPRSAPAPQRSAPQPQYQPRSNPAPQPRSTPQYQPRSAPAPQRSAPQPQYQPRSAPQPQYQPRSAPAPQRSAPQPQYQPRSAPAPQQRSAPQPRSAPAPQQQQRAQPAQNRGRGRDDNDRDRR
jgi:hypothetical protein